jgi:catechol 2,3-dioxygenase-like lactoylglutathione lyase family enzyme
MPSISLDATRGGPHIPNRCVRPATAGYSHQRRDDVLRDKDAMATIAVKDIKTAGKFYGGTLGLKLTGTEGPTVHSYQSGKSTILVYESRYAGTNKATAATWVVGAGIEAIVKDLKAKGVAFEHYDLPDTTRQGDLHVAGDTRVAWFKDPDGNILSIVSG